MKSRTLVQKPGRLDILKILNGRRTTVSELSRSLDISKSAVLYHILRLSKIGFVNRVDDGERKWIYYELSSKGKNVIQSKKITVSLFINNYDRPRQWTTNNSNVKNGRGEYWLFFQRCFDPVKDSNLKAFWWIVVYLHQKHIGTTNGTILKKELESALPKDASNCKDGVCQLPQS